MTFIWRSPPSALIVQKQIVIQEKIPLTPLTAMHVGGSARFFLCVKNIEELKEGIVWAKEKSVPVFVLGSGSNILIPDEGLDALVIKMEIKGIEYTEKDDNRFLVEVGAGEVWDDLVADTVNKGLHGLENLSLIPGTVGAAPVQNIGAYGAEVRDTIESVEVFDMETENVVKLTNEQCKFGYRDSIFKTLKGKKYIIVKVFFLLEKNGTLNTTYRGVKEHFEKEKKVLTLASMRDAIIALRKSKLPNVADIGTVGSFFKNPIVSAEELKRLTIAHPNLVAHILGDGSAKLSAAWLLEFVGKYKDFRRGVVGTYSKHALVLVHYGGGATVDVEELADEMVEKIKKETGIILEREVLLVDKKSFFQKNN